MGVKNNTDFRTEDYMTELTILSLNPDVSVKMDIDIAVYKKAKDTLYHLDCGSLAIIRGDEDYSRKILLVDAVVYKRGYTTLYRVITKSIRVICDYGALKNIDDFNLEEYIDEEKETEGETEEVYALRQYIIQGSSLCVPPNS